ncbi:hypothetical protein OEZ86_003726 [Tetradesmus obliquus]|nr:hypothetical protein OEZ86_003726 [Tetradesmus obliquus]
MQRLTPGQPVSLAELYDQWAAVAISVAAAAWVVLQLPALLAPSSLSGVLLLVVLGAVAGGTVVLLLLVGLFYGLTQPYGETQQRTEPKCSTHTQAKPTAAAVPGTLGAQHHVGPHLSCKGRFSGRVLVVPASRWTAADALQDFAAAAGAGVHWHASCKRGRLKLVAAREPAVKAAAAAAVEEEPAASTAARGARPDKVNLCA